MDACIQTLNQGKLAEPRTQRGRVKAEKSEKSAQRNQGQVDPGAV